MPQAQSMPKFEILQPVLPQTLNADPQLRRWLYESMRGDPLSLNVELLIDQIYARHSILWTWGKGILITTLEMHGCGPVLQVTNVYGTDYLKHLAQIDHDVSEHARVCGAKYIIGDVPHPGLVKHYLQRGGQFWPRVLREVK